MFEVQPSMYNVYEAGYGSLVHTGFTLASASAWSKSAGRYAAGGAKFLSPQEARSVGGAAGGGVGAGPDDDDDDDSLPDDSLPELGPESGSMGDRMLWDKSKLNYNL